LIFGEKTIALISIVTTHSLTNGGENWEISSTSLPRVCNQWRREMWGWEMVGEEGERSEVQEEE